MKKTKNDKPCNISPGKKSEPVKPPLPGVSKSILSPLPGRRIPIPVGVGYSGFSLGGGDPIDTDGGADSNPGRWGGHGVTRFTWGEEED